MSEVSYKGSKTPRFAIIFKHLIKDFKLICEQTRMFPSFLLEMNDLGFFDSTMLALFLGLRWAFSHTLPKLRSLILPLILFSC